MLSLKALHTAAPTSLRVSVHSHDMSIYLVEVDLAGERHWISDQAKRPLRFNSLLQVRAALGALPVTHAELVQASAYNEMVGLSEEVIAPMRLPLVWHAMDANLAFAPEA